MTLGSLKMTLGSNAAIGGLNVSISLKIIFVAAERCERRHIEKNKAMQSRQFIEQLPCRFTTLM
jgi:hypothetical protein